MKGKTPIEEYLDTATEGLRGDAELRRDVKAELAGHLEDARAGLLEQGHSEEEAARDSLKGMGEVLETAASLQEANLRRIKLRGLARIGLQYVLAPVAVVVAVLVSSHLSNLKLPQTVALFQLGEGVFHLSSEPIDAMDPSSIDDKYLILHGDPTREGMAAKQRTLWERHPTNFVYLGNYVSALTAEATYEGSTNMARAITELAAAAEAEPGNARMDLLRAALMLEQASTLEPIPEDEQHGPLSDRLNVNDAETFAEAMDTALAGLKKPYMKRYALDMLRLQHEVLGPSHRFGDWVRQTSMAVAVLLPDLGHYRDLMRLMAHHGQALLQDGKPDEARRYLDAWEPLVQRHTEDAFTLIDVLVMAAIMEAAETGVADLYEQAGLTDDARRTRERASRLRRGVGEWRASIKTDSPENTAGLEMMSKRGSIMTQMLLPAIGAWPEGDRYEASRRLEYTVATELVVVVVSYIMIAMLIGCALVALRWRLGAASAGSIPILLLPRWRRMVTIVICGVLIPFGIFLLVTRYLPWSGHAYSLAYAKHKLLAEFGLLIAAWIFIPAWMTARSVRERCLALGVPVVPLKLRYLRWPATGAGLGLALMWLVPASKGETPMLVASLLGGVLLLAAAIAALVALVQGFGGKAEHGLYYGTLFRSMIPNLALAVMLLGLASDPILVRSEATYLADDSLIADPGGGFTSLETELTNRLLDGIREGFAALEN